MSLSWCWVSLLSYTMSWSSYVNLSFKLSSGLLFCDRYPRLVISGIVTSDDDADPKPRRGECGNGRHAVASCDADDRNAAAGGRHSTLGRWFVTRKRIACCRLRGRIVGQCPTAFRTEPAPWTPVDVVIHHSRSFDTDSYMNLFEKS